ncbi:MAG: hypothetical protein HKUEN07_06250 [Rhodocyclaceae bacterium]|nr:MAG: hypothetical protein HKUEN07_06250 [Rhodocyclaceae bacterium]
MCVHYLFDADFCIIASGWEKGIVEKNVQGKTGRVSLGAAAQPCTPASASERPRRGPQYRPVIPATRR